MRTTHLALLALTALVAPYALATHCEDPFLGRNSDEMRVKDPQTGKVLYYVDNDSCQSEGCGVSVWVYQESNGYPNLQRQDATGSRVTKWTQDDTCHGMIKADTVVNPR